MYQWNLDLKVRRQKILLSIFVFIQIMVLLAVTQLLHGRTLHHLFVHHLERNEITSKGTFEEFFTWVWK